MGGVYQIGQGLTITETFSVDGTPTNPTATTFSVKAPDGTITVYTAGVDPEITNPSAGVFVLALTPTEVGSYYYSVAGTGAATDTGIGGFEVLQNPVSPQATLFPQFGPCEPWIDCSDIRDSCPDAEGEDASLNGIAAMASQVMFEISGRQFNGNCARTVRPVNDQNTCWGVGVNNYWGWSGWPWAWTWDGVTWGWYDQLGCHCSCDALSRVLLPGYPVTQILEVKIGGVVQDPSTYRLDEYQWLTRMRDPAEPNVPLFWPACQVLDLDDDQPGTFSVSYRAGVAAPLAGKMAAAALACELLPGADCKLPSGAVRIVRQGLTIDRLQPLAAMLISGATGIPQIDVFIAAYNPSGLRRRPAIWSPDGPKFARPVGDV